MRAQLLFAALLLVLPGARYAAATDLSSLPDYKPEQQVSGVIRNFGFSLGGMMPIWEAGFRKYQPSIQFDDKFPSGDAAIAGLISGISDLGPQGRELTLTEYIMFYETFGYNPTAIAARTRLRAQLAVPYPKTFLRKLRIAPRIGHSISTVARVDEWII